jgi:hypothetical protein
MHQNMRHSLNTKSALAILVGLCLFAHHAFGLLSKRHIMHKASAPDVFVELGPMIAASRASTPGACKTLCDGNPSCAYAMVYGKHCCMFGQTTCLW